MRTIPSVPTPLRLATACAIAVLVIAPAPSGAFCIDPTIAASQWESAVPADQCLDTAEAAKLCKSWLKQCRKRVNAATKCFFAQTKTQLAFSKSECKLAAFPDTKMCVQEAVGNAKGAKLAVKANKLTAFDDCSQYVAQCEALCD
jgi:hypothetical protein